MAEGGDPFEIAAAMLEGAAPAVAEAIVPHLGEDAFEAAAAIVEAPPKVARLGFGHRTAAGAAYARKCREAQTQSRRADAAEAALRQLNERPVATTCGVDLEPQTGGKCAGCKNPGAQTTKSTWRGGHGGKETQPCHVRSGISVV